MVRTATISGMMATLLFLGSTSQNRPSLIGLEPIRTAVGIKEIRSMILRGTSFSGFNGVTGRPLTDPRRLELIVQLPDHYRRIEQNPLIEQTTTMGFDGAVPLVLVAPLRGSAAPPKNQAPAGFERYLRRYLARLLLGSIADTQLLGPSAKVSSVTGSKGTIQVRSEEGFDALLDCNAEQIPMTLRYTDSMRFPAQLSEADRKAGRTANAAETATVEVTWTFEDRRLVSGVRFPFSIRQEARGVRFEEIRLEEVQINPKIPPSVFKR